MKKSKLYLAAFLIFSCSAFISAQDSKKQNETLEQKIRRLDLDEAEAILKRIFRH
jgi:hypothetical protein